ncbi:Ypt/Rab-GAP domain of gyp1p superfamily protein [Euphorbia peplus]|nr:Ypt/Rab-GAP domain of gyp1p superfamily protein [Euphorbia peplus]
MLLSLLSRRSFDVDSRDAYGFALRPQHIQRYKEYINIYKEEEGERSEKWRFFLEQQEESNDQSCSVEEERLQSELGEESILERGRDGYDSSEKKDADGSSDCDHRKEVQHSVDRNLSLEPETENETKVQISGKSEEEVQLLVEPKSEAGVSVDPQTEVKPSEEPGKEVDDIREPEKEVEHSKEPENGNSTETKEELVQHSDESENSVPLLEEPKKEAEQLSKKEKASKVRTWDGIRRSLIPLENMLSSRVNNTKPTQGETASRDILLEDIQEEVCATDDEKIISVSAEEKNAHETSLYAWKAELEFLVHGGVPKDLRGEVWQAFIGVKARRVERYYEELVAEESDADKNEENTNSASEPRKWKRQIEKDIPRTFPGHPALDEHGRDSLRRLLLAYARHNPSVGYCQAMNFFAGLLLLLMPEENAFWAFVGIIDDYFDGYYTEEMVESQVDQLVFEELMRERFPKLVNHLDYLGVQVAWISGPWFLSIFVNMLPWESVLRVWDVLLFEGNRVMLFRTALALMELYGPALMTTKDAGDAITLLQSLAGSTFDSSQLVFTACMGFLAVDEARLQELRIKHRPSIQIVVEERSKGRKVWKDSKGLASKLYSFKNDKNTSEGVNSKSATDLDTLLDGLGAEGALPDLQEQVLWMKVELCRLLEEKRSSILRAEELETALMEMVKEDNRLELSAKVEQLEFEVAELKQILSDKKEQEGAMLQVLMRVEQDQRITEEARRTAEQDAAAQKYAVSVLQEKYEKAMASLAEVEKRVVMAESMLDATRNYESGQAKALSSPRLGSSLNQNVSSPVKKLSILKFGFGWRDRSKNIKANEESVVSTTNDEKDPSTERKENTN